MKVNYFYTLLICICSTVNFAQTLTNNGGFITAQPGSFIHVNGSVANNNTGILAVNGNGTPTSSELYVTQDVINNSTINADGYIRLLGNWIDNNVFNSTLGTVFFEGPNQFLGGTSITQFFNVTLDGSGIKTQQIDKIANGTLDLKFLHLNTDLYGFYVTNPALNAIIRTTGFVSSANGGFLARTTQNTGMYLFPTGSNANTSANIPGSGTFRYRPVELNPANANLNVFSVRLANLDATQETYNRNSAEPIICEANPTFYHQINRISGTSAADVGVCYVPAADGQWSDLARWNITTNGIWQDIPVLQTTGTAGVTYSWSSNGNNLGTGPNLSEIFTNPGCYDITLTAAIGNCTASTTSTSLICVDNTPSAAFTSSTLQFSSSTENVSFSNNSTGADSYMWDFGNGTTSTLTNPTASYSAINGNVLVTLFAYTDNGCVDSTTTVINYQEETIFYVPNSFTPDQDEYNQTWGPVFTQGFDPYNFNLYIFNRWGELIWESHDASARWDGTYGPWASDCPDGIYTWKIDYKPIETDDKKVITGFITLMR